MDNFVLGLTTIVLSMVFYNFFKIMKSVDTFITEEMLKSDEVYCDWKKANPSEGIFDKGVPTEIWNQNIRSTNLYNFRKSVYGIKSFFLFLLIALPSLFLLSIIVRK